MLELGPHRGACRTRLRNGIGVAALAGYVDHTLRLSGPSAPFFDYGYNMRVNLAVGAVAYALWVGWLVSPFVVGAAPRAGGGRLALFLSTLSADALIDRCRQLQAAC